MREINRKDMLMYVAGSSAIGATIYYVSDKFQLPLYGRDNNIYFVFHD